MYKNLEMLLVVQSSTKKEEFWNGNTLSLGDKNNIINFENKSKI